MNIIKKLPVGIENFRKIRTDSFYYVDKTRLIRDLLCHWCEVNLFTRPRRFGKSLNMDMLKTFLNTAVTADFLTDLKYRQKKSCAENTWGSFRSFPFL